MCYLEVSLTYRKQSRVVFTDDGETAVRRGDR